MVLNILENKVIKTGKKLIVLDTYKSSLEEDDLVLVSMGTSTRLGVVNSTLEGVDILKNLKFSSKLKFKDYIKSDNIVITKLYDSKEENEEAISLLFKN